MEKYFKKERKVQPNPVNKFHGLGIFYGKTKEYKRAMDFFKKALVLDPDHTDCKEKIKYLTKKLRNKKKHLGEQSYNIINGYLINNKITGIEKKNRNFKTFYNLGLYYKEMQMYEQAVAAFKNVLRIRPNHINTHFELSNIYSATENYYEYTNVYNEVELYDIDDQVNDKNDKEKCPEETMPQKLNLSELHYKLAWAFGESKYYFEVIELCKRAINIEAKFVDAYYWLGWIYEKLKKYKGAIFAYTKAIYIDKNYVFAYNRLGNIYIKQQKYGEAIELYKVSIKNSPGNIQAYLKMGFIYNNVLQYDKAIEILKKAIEIDSQNFFLYHLISKSYLNIGWLADAKDALKNAIDIKPDYFKAYKVLRKTIIKAKTKDKYPSSETKIIKVSKKLEDDFDKRDINYIQKISHLNRSNIEDKFISKESITRDSSNKEERGTIAYGGIHQDNNEIPSKKLRKLSNDKISSSKTVFQLYKEYGTLEKVGREVGLTRERIRQILERGNRYGLFEYPIKKELISYSFLIKYFANKEELLNELSDCSKKDEMLETLNTDIINFSKLLEYFNLDIRDVQIYSKKKKLKRQYDEYVENIGYHPRTTEMRKDKEPRNIWVKITRHWGSMANFRQEFGYPFIKQGNPRLKEDIREWHQQRSVLIMLRKKSYMEIILKSLSDIGALNKKYLARECNISEQNCLNILNSMIKRGEIIKLKHGAKTVYMIKE